MALSFKFSVKPAKTTLAERGAAKTSANPSNQNMCLGGRAVAVTLTGKLSLCISSGVSTFTGLKLLCEWCKCGRLLL
ncbi:hypothetical protein MHYP_G00090860 [Metynnis hypsauchen]